MSSDFTWSPKEASFEDGSSLAIEIYGMEKTAFLGALKGLGTAAKSFFSSGAGSAVGRNALKATGDAVGKSRGLLGKGVDAVKAQTSKVTKPLGKLTSSLDRSVQRGTANAMGNLGKRMGLSTKTQGKMKAFGNMATGGVAKAGIGQGLIGGTLVGGISAAAAEDGQGWDAFKKGFGTGALLGGVGGAVGKGVSNVGTMGVGKLMGGKSTMQGISKAKDLAKNPVFKGPNSRMRQLWTGDGPGGRLAAGASLGVGAGALGADIVASEAMMPKTGADQSTSSDPVVSNRQLGGMLGSTSGFLGTGIPLNILADDPGHLAGVPLKGPRGIVYRGVIPAVAGIAGGIGGTYLGSHFDPPPAKPPEQEKLEQVDFDKLLRYYKKKNAPDQSA